jgi:TetR/AcrR family transcriptional regulator, repressor for uid operon
MPAPTEPAPSAAAQRNRARRDQILSAAMKCFVENGFHGSSMAELAKRAGMSVGHIYHYYESKDAIIEAIVDRDIEEAPGMLDAFSGADDLVAAMMDRLDETVERHLDRDRAALRLEMLAEAARNPRIAKKLHSADAAARNRLIQALTGRLPSLGPGEVADRVEATAAIFQGLIVRAVHNPDLDRDAFVRTMRLVLRELLTNDTSAAPPH